MVVKKLDRIVGKAMKENSASIRVLEKLGMLFEGVFDFDRHEGRLYVLTRQKYLQFE